MISFINGLDTPTLKAVSVLIMFLAFIAAAMFHLNLPSERYTKLWAIGSGLAFLGLLGGALREAFPHPLLIPAINTLIAMGGVAFSNGVAAFCKQESRQWPVFGIGIATFVLFYIFSNTYPSLSIRVMLISLLYAALCLRMSWLLWVNTHPRMRLAQRATATMLGLEVLYYWLGIAGAFVPDSAIHFMDAPLAYNTLYLNSIIMFMFLIFALTALTNRRLQLRLEHTALHDMLTGTLNRHALEEAALRELARSRRQQQPLSIIILDVDHFKQINDRHGHQAGDEALRLFAQTIGLALRQEDLLGRIGGEEFCVLLPNTGRGTAHDIAERLRLAVESIRIPVNGTSIRLTTSAGIIAISPDAQPTWAEALHSADQALYAAKRNGRNQVTMGELAPAHATDTVEFAR